MQTIDRLDFYLFIYLFNPESVHNNNSNTLYYYKLSITTVIPQRK